MIQGMYLTFFASCSALLDVGESEYWGGTWTDGMLGDTDMMRLDMHLG